MHAYFLRPGGPALPVLYRVDRIRDGRSFTTRRATAIQNGEAIFNLAASFQVTEPGLTHQVPVLRAPSPDDLPAAETVFADADARTQAWYARVRDRFPVELRFPEPPPRIASLRGESRPPRQGVWIRADQPLPDDPLAHICAVTYASDLFLLTTALPPHRVVIDDPGVQLASLDHAVWFHAAFRADEWMYYDMVGTWTGAGRALCQGRIYSRDGTLIASVVQEGLVRVGRHE